MDDTQDMVLIPLLIRAKNKPYIKSLISLAIDQNRDGTLDWIYVMVRHMYRHHPQWWRHHSVRLRKLTGARPRKVGGWNRGRSTKNLSS